VPLPIRRRQDRIRWHWGRIQQRRAAAAAGGGNGGIQWWTSTVRPRQTRPSPFTSGGIFLKDKTEIFSAFKEWKVMIENKIEKTVKNLRTDNRMKFYSKEFNAYCKFEGLVRYYTIPYTSNKMV
jgi:hypothetical protein